MKNKIVYITLIVGLGLGLISCNRTEEDLFSESAAIRLNKSITEVNELFQSAENGWIMEYIPNNESPGATYLVKFTSSKEVTMATLNKYIPTYKEATGYWQILNDMGPVITFDTYNDVFHMFSDPVAPGTGEADGVGLGGDYEFLITSKTTDVIVLKGKKHGASTILRKLPANQKWQDYFIALNNLNSGLFDKNSMRLHLFVDDVEKYSINKASSRIFSVVPASGNDVDDAFDKPILVTEYGFKFTTPLTIDKTSLNTFKISDDNQRLICTDKGVNAYISGPNPANYYMSNENTWEFKFAKPMGTTFSSSYNSMVANCKSVLKENFTNLYFKYNSARKTYSVSFISGKYTGTYDFNRTDMGDNKVKLTYSGTSDTNGSYYYKSIGGFQSLVTNLSQTFVISADYGINVSSLKFTAVADPNMSFYVSL